MPGGGEQPVVLDEQDAHHQSDDLARREVVARRLVGQLVEAPDEVLEDEPHLLVRHRVRVQVDVAEPGDDEVEDVRLAHPLDLVLELEGFEDLAHVPREAVDVADEVPLDVVGITLELLEVERGAVVEALAGGPVQLQVKRFALDPVTLVPIVFGQDLGLRRGEHAVEPAKHRHGQHDALVLRGPVGAAQQIGDLPDQVREVAVVGHRSARSRRAAQHNIIAVARGGPDEAGPPFRSGRRVSQPGASRGLRRRAGSGPCRPCRSSRPSCRGRPRAQSSRRRRPSWTGGRARGT